jgi:adenylate kinase
MYDEDKVDQIKKWLGAGSINIFGRPFAGKDAQGKRLAELFGGNLIGGGDIMRNTTIPESSSSNIRQGKLAPSEDYIAIVLPYLSQSHLASKPLILSSVGRWHGEENGVIKTLEQSGHPLKAVVFLDISNGESHTRWLAREINNDRQSRHDDTEDVLKVRFDEFEGKTVPVLDFYKQHHLLIEVNGTQTRDQVTKDIIEALFELSKLA